MKCLVTSGGGCYGIIQACFLKSLGIKDIRNYFDTVSGSSIGGINALYLSLGNSAEDLYNAFKHEAPNIFTNSWWRNLNPFNSKYPASGIEGSLKRMLPGKFGDITNINVIIPALNFKEERPKVYDNIVKDEDLNVPIWEIGRATSAAPTFFPPFSRDILLDSGLIENCPIITTIATIKATMEVELGDLELLVIGTGYREVKQKTLGSVSSYTAIDWLRNLLIPFTTKANEMASEFWANNLELKKVVFFNPVKISGDMDDISMIKNGSLERACEPYYSDFEKVWSDFMTTPKSKKKIKLKKRIEKDKAIFIPSIMSVS